MSSGRPRSEAISLSSSWFEALPPSLWRARRVGLMSLSKVGTSSLVTVIGYSTISYNTTIIRAI